MVALCLPLPERTEATKALLRESGFDENETIEILADNIADNEWGSVSPHMQSLVAAFQEDQWAASDSSGGVATCTVGTQHLEAVCSAMLVLSRRIYVFAVWI